MGSVESKRYDTSQQLRIFNFRQERRRPGCGIADGDPGWLVPRNPGLWDGIPLGFLAGRIFHAGCYKLKSFSTFAFTLSSILMSGGQGRLKPSPGSFLVASMPSLLPLAISLVA